MKWTVITRRKKKSQSISDNTEKSTLRCGLVIVPPCSLGQVSTDKPQLCTFSIKAHDQIQQEHRKCKMASLICNTNCLKNEIAKVEICSILCHEMTALSLESDDGTVSQVKKKKKKRSNGSIFKYWKWIIDFGEVSITKKNLILASL